MQIGQEVYIALGKSARKIHVYKRLMGLQGQWTAGELKEVIRYGKNFK